MILILDKRDIRLAGLSAFDLDEHVAHLLVVADVGKLHLLPRTLERTPLVLVEPLFDAICTKELLAASADLRIYNKFATNYAFKVFGVVGVLRID